jgi:hypothetical protein
MTNDVELAAETESDCWPCVLAEKVDTIMTIRRLSRPDAERDRDRSPAGSRARSIASPFGDTGTSLRGKPSFDDRAG